MYKGVHGVHLVLDLDLESSGLRSPKQVGLLLGLGLPGPNQIGLLLGLGLPSKKQIGLLLGLGLWGPKQIGLLLGLGLPGPKQIGLPLGLGLPGPRPDRTPPWTRTPGLLTWAVGLAGGLRHLTSVRLKKIPASKARKSGVSGRFDDGRRQKFVFLRFSGRSGRSDGRSDMSDGRAARRERPPEGIHIARRHGNTQAPPVPALGAATRHLDAPPSCLFRAAGFVGPFVRLMRRCGWPLRAAAQLISYILQIRSSQTTKLAG
jgi:hypothetical protein